MRSALHDVLAYQRRLGLTAIELSGGCCRLSTTTWSTRVLFWTLQVSLWLSAGYYIQFWHISFEKTHTGMANHYAHITEIMEPLSIVILIAWLRLYQDRLLQLLNQLLELLEREHLAEARPNWINCVFLSSNCVMILSSVSFAVGLGGFQIGSLVPYITFIIRQIYFSCSVNVFLVTVHQIEAIWDAQLHKVETSSRNGDLKELSQGLQLIDQIIRICELEMNVIFSVPLCLHFLYTVLEAASIGYIIAVKFDDAFIVGLSVICIAPVLVYAALPTVRNNGLDHVVSIKRHC